MTLDDIIAGLRAKDRAAALTAAVPHAAELAPAIYALSDKFRDGIHLLPDDGQHLFNGLHVLAAARHPALLDHIIAIAHQTEAALDTLFPNHAPISLARLMLSVWDRDAQALFALVEEEDLVTDTGWALFSVLARLTFDGRIPREETVAFLARLEQDAFTDDEDMLWWGWESAVVVAGLIELEPALQRVWSKAVFANHDPAYRDESLEMLKRVAADPTESAGLDEENIRPIDDPVEAVSWVALQAAVLAELAAEEAQEAPPEDHDVAKDLRLTAEEMSWLDGFLTSSQAPQKTMPFEMLDGFLTALVIGPAITTAVGYLPLIWDPQRSMSPSWDGPEQRDYVHKLLERQTAAISARVKADAPHWPLIDAFVGDMAGAEWAEGFAAALDMDTKAWEPLFKERGGRELIVSIMALGSEGITESDGQPLS
jgi:uncharacterized protein